jgi:glycosyltransferase involved in cell wall biosynthesis
MPALEAMSLGIPVVAADRGALPELVGDAGMLVDPRDPEAIAAALERVISDDRLAENLARRGLERSRRFEWSRTAAAMRDAFARAVEERAGESAAAHSAAS